MSQEPKFPRVEETVYNISELKSREILFLKLQLEICKSKLNSPNILMKTSNAEFKSNPFVSFRQSGAISLIHVCFMHFVEAN
jgi:hypothetical protein